MNLEQYLAKVDYEKLKVKGIFNSLPKRLKPHCDGALCNFQPADRGGKLCPLSLNAESAFAKQKVDAIVSLSYQRSNIVSQHLLSIIKRNMPIVERILELYGIFPKSNLNPKLIYLSRAEKEQAVEELSRQLR